jgi:hypothetical protein
MKTFNFQHLKNQGLAMNYQEAMSKTNKVRAIKAGKRLGLTIRSRKIWIRTVESQTQFVMLWKTDLDCNRHAKVT